MPTPLRPTVRASARRQCGVFTRRQALTAYTPDEIRARLDSGCWWRVLHGVYADMRTRPEPHAYLAAAHVLQPDVVGCLHTAAALHRIGVVDDGRLHLARPDGRNARAGPGVRVHRLGLGPGDTVVVDRLRVTSVARTAADLARALPRLDGIAVLDAALTRTDRGSIEAVLGRAAGLRGIRTARTLLDLADVGAESPMESRLRLRIVEAGLLRPVTQYPVGGYRLDLAWPRCRIGAEYDGAVHDGRAAIRADRFRHNRLCGLGWRIFVFTDVDVYGHPERIGALLRPVLSEQRITELRTFTTYVSG